MERLEVHIIVYWYAPHYVVMLIHLLCLGIVFFSVCFVLYFRSRIFGSFCMPNFIAKKKRENKKTARTHTVYEKRAFFPLSLCNGQLTYIVTRVRVGNWQQCATNAQNIAL